MNPTLYNFDGNRIFRRLMKSERRRYLALWLMTICGIALLVILSLIDIGGIAEMICVVGVIVGWLLASILFNRSMVRSGRFLYDKRFRVCPDCEYSLSELEESGKCPECGRLYNYKELTAYWRNKRKK